jgi:hypothetical protein
MLANKPNETRIVITDVSDSILPDEGRQTQCMKLAPDKAGISPEGIVISSTHGIGNIVHHTINLDHLDLN